MPRIPRIKAKDFFKYLKKYGCTNTTIKGSHHKVVNNKNNKTSIVAIHDGDILLPSMFEVILKQLDIDRNDFIKFIEKN